MNDSIKIKGQIDFVITDKNGVIKDKWTVYNTVTNAGLALLASLAGDAAAVPFTYLAVGTSNTAAAASQTALAGEITDSGLARAAATVSRVTTTQTNDTLQLVKAWSVSGTKTVEEIGIFNDPTTGTMLSRAVTGSKAVVNGDTLTATYKVKFA